jgi:hypothetical protein
MAKRKPQFETLIDIGSGDKLTRKQKPNPVSIGLSHADISALERIAEELGQSRHAVMLYAIREFIRRYDSGEKPKTKKVTITKEVFDLE